MSTSKCQMCGHSHVEMWEECKSCHWINDDALFLDEDQSMSVSFEIPKRAWVYYSYANKCTPNAYRVKMLRNQSR